MWHDNITQAQKNSIERLQIVALKIILGNDCPRKDNGHFDCNRALVLDRREKQALEFSKKCNKHPSMKRILPGNPRILDDSLMLRSWEPFKVNHAMTETYKNSAIPAIERRLNNHFS